VFVALLGAGLWAALALGLFAAPAGGGGDVAARFFSRALSPALTSEAPPPHGGRSLVPSVLEGLRETVIFAASALGLAVLLGTVLGFLGSTAWWTGDPAGGRSRGIRALRATFAGAVHAGVRVLIAALRSVHELIWAVILLAALGYSDVTAVLALALPYAGTVAKIVAELIDEAPRGAAMALRAAGAGGGQVFAFGLLPGALPDLVSYLFYQFECAIRSSAVLGFFGFPTLGAFIAASFENLHYGEVWTYLYALVALVLAVEIWSGAIRRRLVS
jgi:phosphonate transport system permease protein